MTHTLLTIFPNPADLLALEPEDLGAIVLELAPQIMQSSGFTRDALTYPLFAGETPYRNVRHDIEIILAEAISWLITAGLLIEEPGQAGLRYRPTRRAQALNTRTDVEQFRKGRMLPVELLQPALAEKVWPLFLRGDYDIAVFQAFKIIEVAVRKAANEQGAGFPDDMVGISLMQTAFQEERGPLRDAAAPSSERKAEMFLFAGAMGRARNPAAHHDRAVSAQEAARLIVYASYLLSIVEQRVST